MGERHEVDIWRETTWPHQWIGQCLCGRGIRCNSRADAVAFFVDGESCWVPAPTPKEVP